MGWTERGELIFGGEVIKGSNIVDLVNDVLRNRKTFDHPHGWGQFARALRGSNVPRDLVGNRGLWDWMHRESATSDAFSSEDGVTPPRRKRRNTPVRRSRYSTPLTSKSRKFSTPRSISHMKIKQEPASIKKELSWESYK